MKLIRIVFNRVSSSYGASQMKDGNFTENFGYHPIIYFTTGFQIEN